MVTGPIGGRIEILGLASFRAAKNEVVKGFAEINKAVKSVGSTALPNVTGGARGGTGIGGRVGGVAVYQRLPVQLGLVSVAAGAAGIAIEKLGATFSKTTNSIEVFGGASQQQAAQIARASIDMSRSYTSSANEIAQAAISLGKAGAPVSELGNNLLKATVVFNEASQGEVSATEASDLLTQTVTALNLEWSDSIKIVDSYVGAVQSSTLTFNDLTTQLKTTLPIAGALKISYEELAATLALLSQNGLRGSIAGTTLKNALLAIADPSEEALGLLQKYNISLFDASGKALPLVEILGRLGAAFGQTNQGISDAQKFFEATDIFNTRQILAALALVNQGTKGFDNMLTAMRKVSSTQIANELQNNVISQLEILGNQLQAGALIASNEFQPTITRALKIINEDLRAVGAGGFRELGMEINRTLSLSNQDFNEFLATIIGVTGGVAEAVAIMKEQLSTLPSTVDTTVDAINSKMKEIPQEATNSSVATRVQFVVLTDELQTSTDLAGQILENLATHVVLLGGVLSGGVKQSTNATGEIAEVTMLQVGIVDRAIAIMIASFNNGIRAINVFLRAVATVTGTDMSIPMQNMFPDVATGMEQAKDAVQEAGEFITGATENVLTSIAAGYEASTAVVMSTADRIRAAAVASKNDAIASIAEVKRRLQPDMPSDMGFWDRIGPGAPPAITPRFTPTGGSTFPSGGGGGKEGGGGAKAEDVDKLAARIKQMLSDIPAMTDELAEFIAGIAKDFPERLQPMVAALKGARGEIGQLVLLKRDMLAVDLQLIDSEKKISGLEAQSAKLDIQQALATIGFDKQLLGVRQQMLELDQQMNPLRDQLLGIERQIAKLQEENLALTRSRLEIELAALPLRVQLEDIEQRITATQRVNFALARERLTLEAQLIPVRASIEVIDKRISDLQKKNFDTARQQLTLQLSALPVQRQMVALERQITDLVDKRQNLLSRREEVIAEGEAADLRSQLAQVEDELATAWESMDVPTIIKLEEQKKILEEGLKDSDKNLRLIGEAQERTARATELATINLELQKVALEKILTPIQRKLEDLAATEELTRTINEITILGLEEERVKLEQILEVIETKLEKQAAIEEQQRIQQEFIRLALEEEKQKIIDQLAPMEEKLKAINNQITAETIRNQITITHLEQERREILAQLQPLEDQRRALERITQEIELLRARAALEFEERKIGIQEMILNEKLRQAELQETKREQNELFAQLVLGFVDSIAASGAFTLDEALEVAQRLRMWNEQIAKLAETVVEFNRLDAAADQAAQAIRDIPKDVTITITTVHKTVYETGGSSGTPSTTPTGSSSSGPAGSDASGGTESVPAQAASMRANSRAAQTVIINNETNYNVDANYSAIQSAASVGADMRALVMLAGRG